ALAVLSKESGALMPCYMLAVEACLFRFRCPDRRARRMVAGYFALFLLLPGVLGLIWIFGLGHGGMLSYAGRDFTMGERLLTETRVIWLYLFWTLLPRISSLSLYHDDIPLSHGLLHPWTTLPAIFGLVMLIGLAVALRRRQPLVTLGIAWFFAGQLMESTIFPLQITFEHRNYLADMGPLLAVLSLVFPLRASDAMPRLRRLFCVLLLAAFAGVTLQRAWHWRNPLTLAESEAYYHPKSPYATYELGQTYANLVLTGQLQVMPDAQRVLLQSLALPNASIIAGTTLAMVEAQVTHQFSPGLFTRIAELLRTRHIGSSDTTGLYSLVGCESHQHCRLPEGSLDGLFAAAFANPYLSHKPRTAADLHVIYGNYLAGAVPRRLNDARAQMLKAVALAPGTAQYRINVVIVDLAMEDAALAEQDLMAVRNLNHYGLLDREIAGLEKNLARLKRDQAAGKTPSGK
ncbi:MAG TPA: hypothetical protein VFM15_09535, partial [Gammaproteobacteria bacterium]|nr:hypothetical protein [Gammaproteobacteria bacterium]